MSGIEAGNKVKIKDLEKIDESISSPVMEDAREYEYHVHGKGGLSPRTALTNRRTCNIILHDKKTDDWEYRLSVIFEPVALRPPLFNNPDYEIYKSDDENMILISDEDNYVFWINKAGLEPVLSGYGGGIKKKRKSKRKKSKLKKSKRKKSKRKKSKRKKSKH